MPSGCRRSARWWARSSRSGSDRCRRRRTSRSSPRGTAPVPGWASCRATAGCSTWRSSSGCTTSSSSTSATPPTWTSSRSASGRFPTIPDQSIARMVAGIEVDVFRPDDELKKLARLAVELGVDGVFADTERPGAGRRAAAHHSRGPAVAGPVGRGRRAVVQLLLRFRLLPLRPGLDRAPRDPVRLRPRLRGQGAAGGGPRAPAAAPPRRAGPDHLRVRGTDAHRCRPGRVSRETAPVPGGLSLRGEPQLLRRALGARDDLAQDARARPDAGRRAVPRRRGRRVLSAPQRGDRRPVGPLQLLGRRRTRAGSDPVARRGPAPQGHPPRAWSGSHHRPRSAYRPSG